MAKGFALLEEHKGVTLDLATIEQEDAATYAMIRKADTLGTFQIESRAQMSMLPRLKPREWYDLVIQIAIVRPGPIEGGMVHPYLRRRSGDEDVDFPKPELRQVLERTHGVPIFQEQVMQLAIVAAEFTPGEADQLRRSMAAWKRHGGLEPFQERLISKMVERGYKPQFANSIFEMIRGFGSYGFPESHAASFALLAYDSCWIKRHHPDAFLAAMLNSQPMGFYAPAQLIQDAKRHQVEVRPVDVTISQAECTLEQIDVERCAVRIGLNLISGLPKAAAERIVRTRSERMFETAEDLALRAELNAHELHAIASSGALKSLVGHRHQAHWQALGVETRRTEMMKPARFGEQHITLQAPTEGQDIVADYASLSFTLGRHPVELLRSKLAKMRIAPAAELKSFKHGRTARACGIVTHRQRPETAKGTIFITLEDETGPVNVIIWNRLFEQQTKIVTASRLLAVQG
ncbi:MAG: error-prone DNA polymerase, partial [Burkholderiaceae bacterium]